VTRPPARGALPARVGSVVARSVLLLTGSTISTLCYALTIRAGLGLGPLFVLQGGFALHAGIAIGTSVTVLGFACIGIAMALGIWPGPGTLLIPVISGLTLDAVLPHMPTLHGWPLRMGVVVGATVAMALGAAMTIRASLGVSPYDAVMLGLARRFGRPLAPMRLGMEGTVLVVGWILGGSVGIGTVITGLLIGPSIQFWLAVVGVRGAAARRPLLRSVRLRGALALETTNEN
jgi:uncharacterized membrane protein YczE